MVLPAAPVAADIHWVVRRHAMLFVALEACSVVLGNKLVLTLEVLATSEVHAQSSLV